MIRRKKEHSLDPFENFHKKYVIMPTESYTTSFPDESRNISYRSTPRLINDKNVTVFYFNTTIELLYYNITFRYFILNNYWYNMMSSLDKNNKKFPSLSKDHVCETATVNV